MKNYLIRIGLQKSGGPTRCLKIVVAVGWALAASHTQAAVIWTGPFISFTNFTDSDPTQPSSQDRITPDVWLTRGSSRGLFNAFLENSYSSFSPINTEWAYGELTNYASLNYVDWVTWNGQHPPNMVGHDAVLHLISDDIYLQIEFTWWNMRSGGFSYVRSTPPSIPEPAAALLFAAALVALALARPRKLPCRPPP